MNTKRACECFIDFVLQYSRSSGIPYTYIRAREAFHNDSRVPFNLLYSKIYIRAIYVLHSGRGRMR